MKAQIKLVSVHAAAALALGLAGPAGAARPGAELQSQIGTSSAVEFLPSAPAVLYLASEASHTTEGATTTTEGGTASEQHSGTHNTAEEAAVEGTAHKQGQHTDTEEQGTHGQGTHEQTTEQPAQ